MESHESDKSNYTFYSKSHDKYSRLVEFFMFRNELTGVKEYKIHPISLSDHALLLLMLEVGREKRKLIWTLNNSYIEDLKMNYLD